MAQRRVLTPWVAVSCRGQGEWKHCGQTSVFKGESQAVDITERVLLGRENTVELKYVDADTHWLLVQVLKKRAMDDVVAEARGAAKHLSVAEGRAFVQQALGTDGETRKHGKAGDDDVMCVAVSKPLSLRCVLTAARLQEPARAKLCRHLEVRSIELHVILPWGSQYRRVGGAYDLIDL